MVRQESAKLSFPGSNPGVTSRKEASRKTCFFFVFRGLAVGEGRGYTDHKDTAAGLAAAEGERMKRRWMSFLLAAVMAVSVMAGSAFAASEPVKSGHGSYDWSGTGVDLVFGEDKNGNSVSVRGGSINSPVKELSECPEMDFVKTIEGVTFSNYIRHIARDSKDADGNPITVYQVYIGLDGAMRSNEDEVEFVAFLGSSFNNQNACLVGRRGGAVDPCEDLNAYKTNTVCFVDSRNNSYYSLNVFGVTPYADGGNFGRANNGTWKKGLTWVFGRCDDLGKKSNGTYGAVYGIRVNQGDDVTYFQVAVTDNINYMGDRTGERAGEVIPTVSAKPTTSAVYMDGIRMYLEAYNIGGNNYFKLRDVAYALRNTARRFQVTWEPDVEAVVNGETIRGAVNMTSNTTYTPVGGEIVMGDGKEKIGQPTRSAILKDGVQVTSVAGYNIGGNNFFKLRDLGELFDFNVSWDAKLGSIIVNGNESYDPTT